MINDGKDQKRNGNFLSVEVGAVDLCITEVELDWLEGYDNSSEGDLAVFFIPYICIRTHLRRILLVSLIKNELQGNISFQNTAHNLFQIQPSHCNLTYDNNSKIPCAAIHSENWIVYQQTYTHMCVHTHTSQWARCHFLCWKLPFYFFGVKSLSHGCIHCQNFVFISQMMLCLPVNPLGTHS